MNEAICSRHDVQIVFGTLAVVLTMALKFFISHALDVQDDVCDVLFTLEIILHQDHLFQILKAKFVPGFHEFHSSLYICAPEFDFLKAVCHA